MRNTEWRITNENIKRGKEEDKMKVNVRKIERCTERIMKMY